MTTIAEPSRAPTFRPRIDSMVLCVLTALFILAVLNQTFWKRAYDYLGGMTPAFIGFLVGISALFIAIAALASVKYLTKPVLIFFILVSSIASWFTDQFGSIIDRDMIRNAAETTKAEAGHLVTTPFLVHVVLTGLLPALLILWVRIGRGTARRHTATALAIILPCVAIFAGAGLGFARTYASVGRLHPDMILTFNPVVPVLSAIKFAIAREKERNIVAKPFGTDARRTGVATPGRPRVTIIVAGETARAANFSLGGYERETNPEMKKQGVVYFPATTSCGTSTAVSIPCMFSGYTRDQYTHRKGLSTQNLLDVLEYAKVDVTWLDNDTGSYHVADRVPYTFLPHGADPRFCRDGECLDAILVDKLDDYLSKVKVDSVIVLHQLGSHGPAYYQRYPDEFRRFVPDCRTAELGKCKPEEVLNVYDNTILYTDHIVSAVIDKLKSHSSTVSGAMLFISDHGESLGENGLYLHGMPYAIAPREQTEVPFAIWLSDDLAKTAGFDMACLGRNAKQTVSHDNFFHSILGLMDVATSVYNPALDVFAPCRLRS